MRGHSNAILRMLMASGLAGAPGPATFTEAVAMAAAAGLGAVGDIAGAAAIDYFLISTSGSDPHTTSGSDLPAPITGQKLFMLVFSQQQAPALASIGGGTSGVSRLGQIDESGGFATLYQKTGFASTSLDISIDYPGSGYSVLHVWRTAGLAFVPGSLVADRIAGSGTTPINLPVTKAANDVTILNSRRFPTVTASPAATQDFSNATGYAGRLMNAAAFSGNVTFSTDTAQGERWAGAFNLTPE